MYLVYKVEGGHHIMNIRLLVITAIVAVVMAQGKTALEKTIAYIWVNISRGRRGRRDSDQR